MEHICKVIAFLFLLLPLSAGAQQWQIGGRAFLFSPCYQTGTTFTESDGNTANGALCGDGATSACTQPWSLVQGSASDISFVSAPYTGFDCGKVMKMAYDTSNQPEVATYGTLPMIPGSASSDIYVEFAYDSTNAEGQAFFKLTTPDGSGTPYYASLAGNGNQCWLGDGNDQVTCSVGVRHLLHVHLAGSSSYDQLDGGTHNTFTASSSSWYEIELGGDSQGANVYIGNVYASTSGYSSCLKPPMILIDGAGGSGTVTTTNLAAGTKGGNKNSWAISSLSSVAFAWGTTAPTAFPTAPSVCGTSYPGTEGESIVETLTASSSDPNGQLTLENYTTATGARVGFEFSYTSTGLNQGVDSFAIADSQGTLNNIQVNDVSGQQELCFENDVANAAGACINYAIQPSTNYWVTFGVSASGNDYLYLYSYPSLTLIGSTEVGLAPNGTSRDRAFSGPQLYVDIGKTGSETVAYNMSETFSNILVDLSSASGPLLP